MTTQQTGREAGVSCTGRSWPQQQGYSLGIRTLQPHCVRHVSAAGLWASYLTHLCPSFLISKGRIIVISILCMIGYKYYTWYNIYYIHIV